MRIALLGPPGSGKGTQGDVLRERLGILHISSGDLLREAVANQTDLGREAKQYMDRGDLVPDELVLDMIQERLQRQDAKAGWLLDGFPRTVAQAEGLDRLLANDGGGLEAVLSIEVPNEEIVVRLGGRRVCPKCGALYHIRFKPPADDEVCDACHEPLATRSDDREETIRARLDVYAKQTAPVLDYYRGRGLLRRIDGTGEPAAVSERLLTALEDLR